MNNIDTLVSKYLTDRYGVTLDAIDKHMMEQETAEEWIESQLVMDDDITSHHEMISIDNELGLISIKDYSRSLGHNTVNDKVYLTSCNDKIQLLINEKGQIKPHVKGGEIKGKKRLATFKYMLEIKGWENSYETDTGWRIFEIVWNNKTYNIGYMVDNPNANFMSKKKSNITTERYYNSYFRQSSQRQTVKTHVQTDEEAELSAYGDSEVGLGSIYTDPIREELQEAIEFIIKVKDKGFTADQIEDLREILG